MRLGHRTSAAGLRSERPEGRGQRGETLLEVLITIILMGVGFTAILSGIFTTVRVADVNSRHTRASIAAQSLAEALQQPGEPIGSGNPLDYSTYEPCATTASYSSIVSSTPLPAGWTAELTNVQLLREFDVSGSGRTPDWSLSLAECQALSSYTSAPPEDRPRDRGMQLLTIEVTNGSTGRPVTDTLVITKRDQRCVATFDNADLGPC